MIKLQATLLAALALSAAGASAAGAQDIPADTGVYGVVRGGIQIDAKEKYRNNLDALASDASRSLKKKDGFTGELGAGYDFGNFRLEQTFGYASSKIDGKKALDDGFDGAGRTRALTLAVAGYVDIPTGTIVTPFVGGGVGISRIKARANLTDEATGVVSRYDDKDYGLRWHADAGVGITVAPKTTVEISGRYSQTSMLKFAGQSVSGDTVTEQTFKPKQSNIAAQIGVRHIF